MAAADYNSTVQGFYVAYYGRPADPAGLTYWTTRLDSERGNLSAILNAFGTSEEATRRFGSGANDAKVQAIYQQTFGRAADTEGLTYYTAELAAGRITLVNIAKAIIDGAKNDDVTIRANRLSAAESFTRALDTDAEKAAYSGSGAEDAARSWVSTVTKDPATLTAAVATIDATIISIVPQTFTLTTSADKFVGGAGPDVFKGVLSALTASTTLQTTDTFDGGAGNDTFDLSMAVNWGGLPTNAAKSIETVKLTNSSAVSVQFDASGISGVTTYTIDASNAAVTLVDVESGLKTINLSGQKGGSTAGTSTTFSTAFAAGAAETATTATTDAITLNLTNVGTSASTSTTGAKDVKITLNDFETINLGVTGANIVQFDKGTKITVTGAGTLNVEDVAAGLTSFDASAATGAITAKLTTNTALATAKTGSANDSLTISEAGATASATIDLGAGTDKVTFTSDGGTVAYKLSGAETVAFTTVTGGLTFAGTNATGIETVSFSTAVAAAIDLVDMGAANLAFDSLGATANFTHTSDHTGSTTLTLKAASSTAVGGTATDTSVADFTFAKAAGALTINANANTTTSNAQVISAAKASSLAVNVASKTAADGTELTVFGSDITTAAATSFKIDSTGSINGLKITAAKATSGTITDSGATADSITLATAKLESLSLTAGNALTIVSAGGVSDLSKVQTLNITANKGTVTSTSALSSAQSIVLGGSATTSGVTLGTIGDATNSSNNVSLTATGLKGGLSLTSFAVKNGFDLNVDVTGATGSVNLGTTDITTGANITLNAAGSGGTSGTFTYGGSITGTGAVKLDAKGAYAVDLGTNKTFTGKSVYIDLSGTTTTSDDEGLAIVATNSATLKLHELDTGSTNTITANTGSTQLDVVLGGSVAVNTININAVSTTTGITVSGNMGAGADVINLDATSSRATGGVTIDVTGVVSGDTVNLTGYNFADTFKGSAGNDVITGGRGADTITTGAGTDTIRIGAIESTYDAFDTITDLSSTDQIVFGWATVAKPTANVTGTTTKAAVDKDTGVATFSTVTTKTELVDKVKALNNSLGANEAVYFQHNGDTYLFASVTGTDNGTDGAVIKLVGISLPSLSTSAFSADATTGLSGFTA